MLDGSTVPMQKGSTLKDRDTCRAAHPQSPSKNWIQPRLVRGSDDNWMPPDSEFIYASEVPDVVLHMTRKVVDIRAGYRWIKMGRLEAYKCRKTGNLMVSRAELYDYIGVFGGSSNG